MSEKFVSLDLGSKNLKICLSEIDQNGEINLLTTLEKEISSFKNGEIIEEDLFISEVIGFTEEFLNQFRSKNLKILLSFSSSTFNFQKIKTKTIVDDKFVSDEDIKKCKSLARASLISSSFEIFYEEANKFFLDNYPTPVRNPLGLEARQLEVELNIIQIFKPYFLKLQEIFRHSRFPLKGFYPNPLGAASIVLDQKTKEEGTLLIDLGYKTTSCVSFYENSISDFFVFNFGLEDILSPILNDLAINYNEFAKIIDEMQDSGSKKQTFKIKKQIISLNSLIKTLEKRINFFFKKNKFLEFIDKEKNSHPFLGGCFLIGGVIYLPEIENIFKKLLKISVRKGVDLKGRLKNKEDLKFLNALGNVNLYLKSENPKSLFGEIFDYFKNFFSNIFPF